MWGDQWDLHPTRRFSQNRMLLLHHGLHRKSSGYRCCPGLVCVYKTSASADSAKPETKLAAPDGFAPSTSRVRIGRSARLSYRAKDLLPRGLAPRTSAFAGRRAELLHFGSETGCKKMAAASGIAPNSPRLQRGANLSQLHSHGPSARYRAAVDRLSADCSAFELQRNESGRPTR